MAGDILGDLVGGVLREVIGSGLRARSGRKPQVGCALRVTHGSFPGLTGEWLVGVAVIGRGVIQFHPGAKEAVEDGKTNPDRLEIYPASVFPTASIDDPRPGLPICRMALAASMLEWAIPEARQTSLLKELGAPGAAGPRSSP
jgi:hypothetical protein